MNNQLLEIFNLYKNLRAAQEIVGEIYSLDRCVRLQDLESGKHLIDFCIGKYNKDIKLISGIKRDVVVVDHDEHLYDDKTEDDIMSDIEYIRDCLIVIGAVRVGIRSCHREVIEEVGGI